MPRGVDAVDEADDVGSDADGFWRLEKKDPIEEPDGVLFPVAVE